MLINQIKTKFEHDMVWWYEIRVALREQSIDLHETILPWCCVARYVFQKLWPCYSSLQGSPTNKFMLPVISWATVYTYGRGDSLIQICTVCVCCFGLTFLPLSYMTFSVMKSSTWAWTSMLHIRKTLGNLMMKSRKWMFHILSTFFANLLH